MLKVYRIDLINGHKYDSFPTDVRINENMYKQFKKDYAALYSKVHKKEITIALHYIDLNK